MEAASQQVAQGTTMAESATSKLQKIESTVAGSEQSLHAIADALDRMAAIAQEVVVMSQNVSRGAEDNSALTGALNVATEEMNDQVDTVGTSAGELVTLAGELWGTLSYFKVPPYDATPSTEAEPAATHPRYPADRQPGSHTVLAALPGTRVPLPRAAAPQA